MRQAPQVSWMVSCRSATATIDRSVRSSWTAPVGGVGVGAPEALAALGRVWVRRAPIDSLRRVATLNMRVVSLGGGGVGWEGVTRLSYRGALPEGVS